MNVLNLSLVDIDECQVNNGGCHHDCINTPGSRVCACNKGYFLAQDKVKCEGTLRSNTIYLFKENYAKSKV